MYWIQVQKRLQRYWDCNDIGIANSSSVREARQTVLLSLTVVYSAVYSSASPNCTARRYLTISFFNYRTKYRLFSSRIVTSIHQNLYIFFQNFHCRDSWEISRFEIICHIFFRCHDLWCVMCVCVCVCVFCCSFGMALDGDDYGPIGSFAAIGLGRISLRCKIPRTHQALVQQAVQQYSSTAVHVSP